MQYNGFENGFKRLFVNENTIFVLKNYLAIFSLSLHLKCHLLSKESTITLENPSNAWSKIVSAGSSINVFILLDSQHLNYGEINAQIENLIQPEIAGKNVLLYSNKFNFYSDVDQNVFFNASVAHISNVQVNKRKWHFTMMHT